MKKVLASFLLLSFLCCAGCSNVSSLSGKGSSLKKQTSSTRQYTITNTYIVYSSSTKLDRKLAEKYAQKYNKSLKEDLLGKTKDSVLSLFGKPAYEVLYTQKSNGIKTVNNEPIYIYALEGQESSALFISFKNNNVKNYKIDEFNGFNEDAVADLIM